jgi:hypothetical protein
LIAEGQKQGLIATQDNGRPKVSSAATLIPENGKRKTLSDLGITRDQSSQWPPKHVATDDKLRGGKIKKGLRSQLSRMM